MVRQKPGLTPRHAGCRTWLYGKAPDMQREVDRVDKQFKCHECQQWGHKARDCPNKQKWHKGSGKKWTNNPQRKKWYEQQSDEGQQYQWQQQQQRSSSSSQSWIKQEKRGNCTGMGHNRRYCPTEILDFCALSLEIAKETFDKEKCARNA